VSIQTSIIPVQSNVDGMAVIGRTKHQLMGIRYAGGEGGDGGDAAAQAAAAKSAEDAAAEAEASKAPWTAENFDPARAQRLVENLRGDIAAQKASTKAEIDAAVKAATADAVKQSNLALAKLLGGGEELETDPAKLQARVTELTTKVSDQDATLTTAQAAAKAGQISTQVAILAHGLGGSPKLLLANEKFKASIASVEPTDEAAIAAIITAELQANPALKATPPSSGSPEHKGGSVPDLEALLAKATKDGDVASSITLKRRIAAAKASA